jgi:hypothetical protein
VSAFFLDPVDFAVDFAAFDAAFFERVEEVEDTEDFFRAEIV